MKAIFEELHVADICNGHPGRYRRAFKSPEVANLSAWRTALLRNPFGLNVRDEYIKTVFLDANRRIATLAGVPARGMNPAPENIDQTTPAALSADGSTIGLNMPVLRTLVINLAFAVGVLAHEYGHVCNWPPPPSSDIERRKIWELAADHFSGRVLAFLGLDTESLEVFLLSLPSGDPAWIDPQLRIQVLREGYQSVRPLP